MLTSKKALEARKLHAQFVKERMAIAAGHLAHGGPTDAVRETMNGMVCYFNKLHRGGVRSRVKRFRALETEWPKRGIRLGYANELVAVFDQEQFEAATARLYFSFVSYFIKSNVEKNRRSRFLESFWQECLDTVRYISAQLPPSWGKTRLTLTTLRMWLLDKTVEGAAENARMTNAIAILLNEPKESARRIYRDYADFSIRLRTQERDARAKQRLADEQRAGIVWRDEKEYVDFVRRDNRSRLLTTMHFGDFDQAMARVGSHALPGRQIIQLRRGFRVGGEEASVRNYEQRGIGNRTSRNGEMPPVQIVSALRKGNVTLTALFDLNAGFGETIEVSFLGRPAYFVKGPVELAIVGRAPIVAFASYRELGRDFICTHELIETSPMRGECLQDAVQRITQKLISFAEVWVRRYPYQWQLLRDLPSYFNRDFASRRN